MGKHSAPRTRLPFWAGLVTGSALGASVALAGTALPTVTYQHTVPAAQMATRQPEAWSDADVAADNDDLYYALQRQRLNAEEIRRGGNPGDVYGLTGN